MCAILLRRHSCRCCCSNRKRPCRARCLSWTRSKTSLTLALSGPTSNFWCGFISSHCFALVALLRDLTVIITIRAYIVQNISQHWSRVPLKSARFPRFYHARHVRKEALALGTNLPMHACLPLITLQLNRMGSTCLSTSTTASCRQQPLRVTDFCIATDINSGLLVCVAFVHVDPADRIAGVVMTDMTCIYQFIYVALSILGTFVSPYFFSAHLLDIALQNAILQARE